jgi:hypothetical protein
VIFPPALGKTTMPQPITQFYTGIPNFVPDPDNWEKEIEPFILKQAKEVVALERTR